MSFSLQRKVHINDLVFSAKNVDNHLIFKSTEQLMSHDWETLELEWSIQLADDQMVISSKPLAISKGLAITVENFGNRKNAEMLAVEIKTGKVVWHSQLQGCISAFGFTVFQNVIFTHTSTQNNQFFLSKFDIDTGSVLEVYETKKANGIIAANHQLYLPSSKGLAIIQENCRELKYVTESPLLRPTFYKNHLYFYEGVFGPKTFYRLDTNSNKLTGQVKVTLKNLSIEAIIPLDDPENIAVVHKLGFLIVNFQQEKIVKEVSFPEIDRMYHSVLTSYGLITTHTTKSDITNRKFSLHSTKTGELISYVNSSEIPSAATLFFVKGQLIISSLSEAGFFSWSD